jgi:hypothetical protein
MVVALVAIGCASGDSQMVGAPPPTTPAQVSPGAGNDVIPTSQQLDVRLLSPLSSETAKVEQRFETTTIVDLMEGEDVLVPAGSLVRGVVSSVDDADRLDRTGRMTLAFDRLTVRGRSHDIRAHAVQAFESEGIREELPQIAAGAGVGALLGGLIGGVRGTIAGILIGGGGVIAATEGEDVELPVGTVLRIQFDSPVMIR